MSTTIATSEVPLSLINAQGTAILDPIAIKKSSAAKMRLADKTGNVALRKEAAAEQSFADRLGGRTALLSDELKKQIQDQKEATQTDAAPEDQEAKLESNSEQATLQIDTKRSRQIKNTEGSDDSEPRQRQPLQPSSEPFLPKQEKKQSAAPAISIVGNLPPEAIILKLDAASKQSIADKTGNLILKRTAALEQSLADKMAFVNTPGVTTTALRAGRKGFMLDPLLQAIISTPIQFPAAPKQKPQQTPSTSQQRQQRPPQAKKERSYFASAAPVQQRTRADENLDWRTPKTTPSSSPTHSSHTSPTQVRKSVSSTDVASTIKAHMDEIIKKEVTMGPVMNPLAPCGACM